MAYSAFYGLFHTDEWTIYNMKGDICQEMEI